ncbi:MAG: InlB B-repeat-containing protein [Treponema sp.]|jgi:uncharacterized repeat protein (TIGR02543 family)|nr:InlB B-repeat-containing protein [Treponema sp.]
MQKKFLMAMAALVSVSLFFMGCPSESKTETYTVSFDTQGGSEVKAVSVEDGAKITKPADPTKEGQVFGGWYEDKTLETEWDFDEDTVTGNITLYAKWSAARTVSFDSKGGSTVSAQTVAEGARITAPSPAPTKDGYTFVGWYKEEALTNVWNFSTDTVTGDITLYAKWEEGSPGSFTVSFDSKGGSAVEAITNVTAGNTITAPTAPTKTGYGFGGWYKEEALTTPWDFATDTVSANTTLYAKWLSSNAGLTSVLGKTITAGTQAGTQAAPKAASITLAAATAAGSVKADSIATAAGASTKLYSDAAFTSEAAAASGITLTLTGTKDVYILVTAEDGTKLYYKVSITLPQDVSSTVALDGTAGTHYTTGLSISSATKLGTTLTVKVAGTGITSNLGTANENDFIMVSGSKGHGSKVALVKIAGFYNGFNPAADHTEWWQGPALGGYEDADGTWPPASGTTIYKVLTDAQAFTNLANGSATYMDHGVNNGTVFWKTTAGAYNKAGKITGSDNVTTATARRVVLQKQDDPTHQVEVWKFIPKDNVYTAHTYTIIIDYTGVTWK